MYKNESKHSQSGLEKSYKESIIGVISYSPYKYKVLSQNSTPLKQIYLPVNIGPI